MHHVMATSYNYVYIYLYIYYFFLIRGHVLFNTLAYKKGSALCKHTVHTHYQPEHRRSLIHKWSLSRVLCYKNRLETVVFYTYTLFKLWKGLNQGFEVGEGGEIK